MDNHFINNVVFSLIHTDGSTKLPAAVWDRTEDIRQTVLQTIRELSPSEYNFLFTNEMIEESETDVAVFKQIHALAEDRRANFLPVRLLISVEELCRRIATPERAQSLKSTDPTEAMKNASRYHVFTPKNVSYFDLDVTNLDPANAASMILNEAERRFAHR